MPITEWLRELGLDRNDLTRASRKHYIEVRWLTGETRRELAFESQGLYAERRLNRASNHT